MVRTLSTAEERRETVLEAAVVAFAEGGLHGTPTARISDAAGISHAYLFRLFPTKTDLFVAAYQRGSERIVARWEEAVDAARRAGEDPLDAMGKAYVELLSDRSLLLIQLHAHAAAAAGDATVQAAVRTVFGRLATYVSDIVGDDRGRLQSFLATGMLLNTLAAMNALDLDEDWARDLCPTL